MPADHPLQEHKRIHSLDVMRGIAILGIVIANSIHFQYGLFPSNSVHNLYPLGAIDQLAEHFILLFAQASFYPLFSFLFGYGIVLLKERVEKAGGHFPKIFWRRMLILLVIGYVHGVYIWDGDILFVYALTAFLFYFYLTMSDRTLLIWSLIFFLILASTVALPEEKEQIGYEDPLDRYTLEEFHIFTEGSYVEVVNFRKTADPLGMGIAGEILLTITSIITVISMFLLGAYVARKKWLEKIETYRPLLKRISLITLLIGFPCKFAFLLYESGKTELLHATIGGPFVALFYISMIALFSHNGTTKRLLQPFANVGRLSLTNYLLQSVVFTTLYYGYGFGLFNSLGMFFGLFLSVLFFVLQLIVSNFWLKHFYYGPLEWLWRIATYGTFTRFKRRHT